MVGISRGQGERTPEVAVVRNLSDFRQKLSDDKCRFGSLDSDDIPHPLQNMGHNAQNTSQPSLPIVESDTMPGPTLTLLPRSSNATDVGSSETSKDRGERKPSPSTSASTVG